MAKKKATVINCHELGIRKAPWITEIAEETLETVKAGSIVEIMSDKPFYSWDDKEFLKVKTSSGAVGYAIVNCLKFM